MFFIFAVQNGVVRKNTECPYPGGEEELFITVQEIPFMEKSGSTEAVE